VVSQQWVKQIPAQLPVLLLTCMIKLLTATAQVKTLITKQTLEQNSFTTPTRIHPD